MQVDFVSRDKDAVIEALAELRKENDALVLVKRHLEDLRHEPFKQLTTLVSESQMEYSLVRMNFDKTNAKGRLAKVRMSIVAQIVTEGRCTRGLEKQLRDLVVAREAHVAQLESNHPLLHTFQCRAIRR